MVQMNLLNKNCSCSGIFEFSKDQSINNFYIHKDSIINSLKIIAKKYELLKLEVNLLI